MLQSFVSLYNRVRYAPARMRLRVRLFVVIGHDRAHADSRTYYARLDRDTKRLAAQYRETYVGGLFRDTERYRAI